MCKAAALRYHRARCFDKADVVAATCVVDERRRRRRRRCNESAQFAMARRDGLREQRGNISEGTRRQFQRPRRPLEVEVGAEGSERERGRGMRAAALAVAVHRWRKLSALF